MAEPLSPERVAALLERANDFLVATQRVGPEMVTTVQLVAELHGALASLAAENARLAAWLEHLWDRAPDRALCPGCYAADGLHDRDCPFVAVLVACARRRGSPP